jgi:hypothetical protein
MTSLEKRKKVKRYIDNADDRFLEMVYAMMEANDSGVIGYEMDGSSLTRSKLKKKVKQAEERIARGKYTSQETLEKKSKHW